MASKKYVIQPVSLPPPTRQRGHNGSRSQPVLAKNSKSLHALGPSDLKKKEKETIAPPPLYSPFTPYDHKDLDNKYTPDKTVEDARDQTPADLATDLKCFRDYVKKEEKFASDLQSAHPFQYISGEHPEETEEGNAVTPNRDVDFKEWSKDIEFKAWIKDMNTKIVTKKLEVKTDKKNAELAQHEEAMHSPRSPPAAPPPKKSHSFFHFGKKKKHKKEEVEYDTLEQVPRRVMTAHNLSTSGKQQQTESESVKLGRVFSHPTTGKTSSSSKNASTPPEPPSSDLRLFQVVRTRTSISEDDDPSCSRSVASSSSSPSASSSSAAASSSSSSSSVGKSKSFSFRSRLSPPTPKPTHHSEHDMRTKRLPRNVVSVSITT